MTPAIRRALPAALLSLLCLTAQAAPELLLPPHIEPARCCLVKSGRAVFFITGDTNAPGVPALWKSDGTREGTSLVKTFSPSPDFEVGTWFLTDVEGTLFLLLTDFTRTQTELWKSDGTEAGTVRLKSMTGKVKYDFFYDDRPQVAPMSVKGMLFFFLTDRYGMNMELWRSDGTEAGTLRLMNQFEEDNIFLSMSCVAVQGTFFFLFEPRDPFLGIQLWKSDGTEEGTVLVRENPIPHFHWHTGSTLMAMDETLYFVANTQTSDFWGRSFWRSDGTTAGTVPLSAEVTHWKQDIPFQPGDNGILYVTVENALMRTDGSQAGTVKLTTPPKPILNLYREEGGYFITTEGGLWKSDGTVEGTRPIKQGFVQSPRRLKEVNGLLYFQASLAENVLEWWSSDGTEAGTLPIATLSSDFRSFNSFSLPEKVNGRFLFFTDSPGRHTLAALPLASVTCPSSRVQEATGPNGVASVTWPPARGR